MKLKNYCATAAAVAFGVSSASAAMVANYTFDNTLDLGENTGSGSTTWNESSGATAVAGKFGGAGAFDGGNTQFWNSTFSTLGIDGASFSLSMHVKGTPADWTDFVSFGNAASGIVFFEQTGGGGAAVWGNGASGGLNLTGGPVVNDGGWHQLGVVADGATISFYVDGVLVSSQANTLTGTLDSFQIGARWAEGRNITADIDDVAIYDTALSAGEMLHLSSNAAAAVPEPSAAALLGLGGLALILRRRK